MPLDWVKTGEDVFCFPGTKRCHVLMLEEPKKITRFHDEGLSSATKEINAILQRAARSVDADGRELRMLETPTGMMLAWATCGETISPENDQDDVLRALGLATAS